MSLTEQTRAQVAVIGCGYWGSNLVRNFSDLGVLAAICDKNPDQARRLSGRYQVRTYTVEDVLGDTNIDAVAIATPAETHSAIAEKALLAGKHVFVEKPVALDVGTAEKLKRLSKQQARVLMVGHVLQYHPAFIRLKELVVTPALRAGSTSVWAQYTIQSGKRDAIAQELKQQGVPTAIYYPAPLHRQTAYKHYPHAPDLAVSERLCAQVLSLPMHPYLEEEAQGRICDIIRQAL